MYVLYFFSDSSVAEFRGVHVLLYRFLFYLFVIFNAYSRGGPVRSPLAVIDNFKINNSIIDTWNIKWRKQK